ncbi:putative beta-glucosidase G [Paramyrothecium foliicola]|nr:putative beta-glucosidase G [Paramyrothecium foliicola]
MANRRRAAWQDAHRNAHDFVAKHSTAEKIGLTTGGYSQPILPCVGSIGPVERLDFEGICFSDGPAGFTRADGVSVFASGITVAASWDKRLMYARAVAIGEEFRAKGSHVHLGPSSGPMGRHALGGRKWESFGPDPYLAGVAMNASVSGVQSVGVQACSKHYIGNEQETQRTSSIDSDGTVINALSSNIDDRTLHELYLWPFADAVKAGTASIMCAYNRVNGNYSCANPRLLEILKDELGFQGYVVSDWSATHDTIPFANAGLDLEMPGNVTAAPGSSYFGDLLLDAVSENKVTTERLDEMAERVLKPYFLLGQNEDFPTVDPSARSAFSAYQYGHNSPDFPVQSVVARDVRGDHAKTIRELGAAATVLLKNVNGSVFLDVETSTSFEMGTLDIGGGSGTVRHTDLVAPLDAIQQHVRKQGGRVQVLMDHKEIIDGRFRTIYPVPEICLVFLKAFATEVRDRETLDLDWNATRVVENTAALCPNTIVIIHGPGVVLMPWADNENVTAILSAHYPGEQTGNSLVDVLWGLTEPASRLPYTVPKTLDDYGAPIFNLSKPASDPDAWQVDFSEGQLIDYRHFDANNIEPLYEFGFG